MIDTLKLFEPGVTTPADTSQPRPHATLIILKKLVSFYFSTTQLLKLKLKSNGKTSS
jgi:hypothetical protein